jgi:Fur family ferric uptake transcriptional regulator
MLRRTPPRLQVLDVFKTSPVRHLTADEVYRQLLERQQPLGLATVYKVLAQFEQAGILQRSDLGHGRHVFELPLEGVTEHGHLVCSNGQVAEFALPHALKDELVQLAEQQGWDLTGFAITAYARPKHTPQAPDSA